ncbi:MAG: S8 family serine peptidase [Chloroflexota bacterium]
MGRHLLAGCLCLLLILPPLFNTSRPDTLAPTIRRALDRLPPGETIRVIVRLTEQVELEATPAGNVLTALREQADTTQAPLRGWLQSLETEGRARHVTPLWIFNGLAVTAPLDVILEIAARPDVAHILLDEVILASPRFSQTPDANAGAAGENLTLIGAPEAWARGITGEGIVVAVLDSGADLNHPDLKTRWRGGTNSWFDPNGEFPDTPTDIDGHGTQVLGVILGGDASGSPIGIAPGAQWIAAKIFDSRGRATTSGAHQALQWVLDPDGDPATDDAPDIVNNSWAFATNFCDLEFADDLRALRAAGILPVFAAGVDGPFNPANMPDAFAVGALAGADTLAPDSPRGPSPCADKPTFPQVVAPGVNIRTSDLFSTYNSFEGTSLAAAHVSGALALLLSADPALTAEEQESLLIETAVDLGDSGPDNEFGYGRVNVAAALDRLLGPDPAARATAVAPATPAPPAGGGNPGLWLALAGVLSVVLLGLAWRRKLASR